MRKKIFEAGLRDFTPKTGENLLLGKKISGFRERGYSYQRIADVFNFWRLKTLSAKTRWYAKTVRDIVFGK